MDIGFIGFGLIGGSIAKGLKKVHPEYRIIVTSRSKAPLYEAQKQGVVDILATEVDNSFKNCDYIFLCTPVITITYYLQALKNVIKPECIITDVGSVKGYIHQAVHDAGLDSQFIGGHPMAGSERSGFNNSSDTLLKGAIYILTPTNESPADKLDWLKQTVEELGAVPVVMDCKQHDYAVAGISHVPHLISAALAILAKNNDDYENHMHTLAAGGFKDTTRIAASSPEMWEQICVTNRDAISTLLGKYIKELNIIKSHIDNDSDEECSDYIKNLFNTAGEYRNSFK